MSDLLTMPIDPNIDLELEVRPNIYIIADGETSIIPENMIKDEFFNKILEIQYCKKLEISKYGIFTGTWDRWFPDRAFEQITLPFCEYFNIKNFMITKLPQLPECIYLSCRDCDILEELSDIPECMYLDCNGCTALKRIPESDKIIYINFNECRVLKFTREFANNYNARLIREITPEMEILGITELPEAIPESMILHTGGTIPLEYMLNKKLTMYPFLLNL